MMLLVWQALNGSDRNSKSSQVVHRGMLGGVVRVVDAAAKSIRFTARWLLRVKGSRYAPSS
jgi:hypothetical protein